MATTAICFGCQHGAFAIPGFDCARHISFVRALAGLPQPGFERNCRNRIRGWEASSTVDPVRKATWKRTISIGALEKHFRSGGSDVIVSLGSHRFFDMDLVPSVLWVNQHETGPTNMGVTRSGSQPIGQFQAGASSAPDFELTRTWAGEVLCPVQARSSV